MTLTNPEIADPPPFRRPLQVDRLRRDAESRFRIGAEPAERAALARFLDVDAVERLTLAGFIGPHGKDGWRVRGRLVAKIVQTCVVTLEPLRTRFEEEIERCYVPQARAPHQHEVVMLPGDDDAPDPFADTIDPAQLAVESLALLIDPYPRRAGAALDSRGAEDDPAGRDDAGAAKPFAGLADLIRRAGSGGT